MVRLRPAAGVALLLAPAIASAQDATVLVVTLGPPLVAAPVVSQYLRSRWFLPRNGTGASLTALVTLAIVEWLLWLVVGYLGAMVFFQESWLALVLVIAGLAALLLTMRSLGAPHRSWGFTLAMFAVFPSVFGLVLLLAMGGVFAPG